MMNAASVDKRQPQFELLRIISMMLIVTLHFMSHGGVNERLELGTITYFVFSIIRALAYLGVNCFVLLSGYFLCESRFRPSRIVKIALQVLFYSVLGTMVFLLVFHEKPGMKELLFTVFPISGNKYWFASIYIVMLFVAPILNHAISKMEKKEHLTTAIILLVAFSFIPTILFWSKGVYSDGKDIGWFITLYVIAAYIRKYPIARKKRNLWIVFCACMLLTVVIEYIIHVGASALSLATPEKILYYNNSPFITLGGGTSSNMEHADKICSCGKAGQWCWRTHIWSVSFA